MSLLLLLIAVATEVRAEEALPQKLQKMSDTAYHYYSSRQTEKYFDKVAALKSATEFSSYQETYYRACSYEAIYWWMAGWHQKSEPIAVYQNEITITIHN